MTTDYTVQGIFAALIALVLWFIKRKFESVDEKCGECTNRVNTIAEKSTANDTSISGINENLKYIRGRVDEIAKRMRM